MSELRPLKKCPFCEPPHVSRRLGRHLRRNHQKEIKAGILRLTLDGRVVSVRKNLPKVVDDSPDSMPKAVIELRRR